MKWWKEIKDRSLPVKGLRSKQERVIFAAVAGKGM